MAVDTAERYGKGKMTPDMVDELIISRTGWTYSELDEQDPERIDRLLTIWTARARANKKHGK